MEKEPRLVQVGDNTPINNDQVEGNKLTTVDDLTCKIHGKINGLYYYYLEEGLYSAETTAGHLNQKHTADNTTILGTTNAIQNVAYCPFMNIGAKDLSRISYDTTRFGKIDDFGFMPFVYRITTQDRPKELAISSAKPYPTVEKPSVGTKRNYKYESRLLDYPYRSITFMSNIFDAYEVIPHLLTGSSLDEDGYCRLYSVMPVNPGGNFYLYVPGYKGLGQTTERLYSSSSMDLPNSSSAYSNYMSTQKAQTATGLGTTILGTAVSAGLAYATGGLSAIATPLITGGLSAASSIAQTMAKTSDLKSTPNTLKSMGGDVSVRLGYQGQAFVDAMEVSITDDYKQLLGDYFAMYGYKQNKLMKIDLRSRHYYNYIKTIGCNVKGTGVPKKHLEKIKQIMDKGTTFWHVDRNGGLIADYTYDNTEV